MRLMIYRFSGGGGEQEEARFRRTEVFDSVRGGGKAAGNFRWNLRDHKILTSILILLRQRELVFL